MTGKNAGTKRKATKRKSPSQAEMKRQVASAKAENDELRSMVGQITVVVKELADKVDVLSEKDKPVEHDQNQRMMSTVFKDEIEETNVPDKPEDTLPAHLQVVKNAIGDNDEGLVDGNDFAIGETSSMAKDQVINRGGNNLDTDNQDVGQLEGRDMKAYGPASESLEGQQVQDAGVVIENRHWSKDKLAYEAFMHEHVLVRLHETTDDTMIPLPLVTNGGVNQFFIRGEQQWVRRKYIEPLARAKRTTYTQQKITDDGGNDSYRQVPHTTLLYPFEVLQDTDRGRSWLKAILAESY